MRYTSHTVRSPVLPSSLPPWLELVLTDPSKPYNDYLWERDNIAKTSPFWLSYAHVLAALTRRQALEELKDLEELAYGPNPRRYRKA
jgi:hypothetical protein